MQEDSRIDQYPKLVNGDSRVVWEWQGKWTVKGRECACNSYRGDVDMVFMKFLFMVYWVVAVRMSFIPSPPLTFYSCFLWLPYERHLKEKELCGLQPKITSDEQGFAHPNIVYYCSFRGCIVTLSTG